MAEDTQKSGNCNCCSGSGCGCGCRGRALKALVPFLLGGIIGYLVAGRCAMKHMCPMPGERAPLTQPTTPAPMPGK